MTNEETEAAARQAANKAAIIEKHPSSFFDLGKARQTVYSILMGFVLKYFIEHAYESRDAIFSLDASHFIAYLCILIYFFLNCFRFLFGLVDYSNMTDDKFAPQENDWKKENFWKNTFKVFVVNTGVFQLIVFSFAVFILFPHFDEVKDITPELKGAALVASMPHIILGFCISTLLLLVIDIVSLSLFKKYVANKDFDEPEQVRFIIWFFADWLETAIAAFLLISILITRPECASNWQNAFFIILALLALIETISIYKYFESPLMSLRDLTRRIKAAIKSWKTKE
jgi:hypothetical protein